MPTVWKAQYSFNNGELSPHIMGRIDVDKYDAGAQKVENFLCTKEGPVVRRSGARFVREVKDSSAKTRLVSFVFSDEQAYTLELGDLYCRFYRDEGVILSGGVPVELTTPYVTADLFGLHFAQSADVLYVTHKDYAPRKISRTSHTSWTLSTLVFQDGPYLPPNTTATTLTPSGTSGSVTITASAVTGINGGSGFQAHDVGRLIRFNSNVAGDSWDWMTITAVTDTTHVVATINGSVAAFARSNWRLGSFYIGSYPRTVSFFEQRLGFAGETDSPQTLHGSMSGDFERFSPSGSFLDSSGADPYSVDDIFADNSLEFTIAANQVQIIRWMGGLRNLLLGTPSGIWAVQASSSLEAITPDNVNIRQTTSTGASSLQPVFVEDAVIFAGNTNKRIYSLQYLFERDAYVPIDLTLLAEHVTGSGITAMAYAQEPESIIWAATTDGELIGCTFNSDQKVIAWHRHILGGSFSGGPPVVESLCVIPSPNGDHDQLWMVVKRTVDGATVRYIEFLEEEFGSPATIEDAFFVDSGLSYDGAATTTLTGLDHLEGETVQVLADGSVHPDCVVSGGAITLSRSVTKAHVGLGYPSDLETTLLDLPDPQGSSMGKLRRMVECSFRFDRTVGLEYGTSETDLHTFDFRKPGDAMDDPVPLFTGDKRVPLQAGWSRDERARIYIRQSQPLPMTLLAINPHAETSAR